MLKRRLLFPGMTILVLVLFQALGLAANGNSIDSDSPAVKFSQWMAKRFVLKSATFQFDGIRETLQLTDSISLSPKSCGVVFEFDCANGGYGDRGDVDVTVAITHHVAYITVKEFEVVEAVLDQRWDMLEQKLTGEDSQEPQTPPTAEEIQALVRGNNAFAFDLYQALTAKEDGNIFYSPQSISTALAMTYAGARTDTEAQMAETLHFDLAQARLHPAFKQLGQTLTGRASDENGGVQLHSANAVWGQEGYAFLEDYSRILDDNYAGGLQRVDFQNATEEARLTINQWVADQTGNYIPELIQPGILTRLTKLILTNAVYFKGTWQYTFDEALTSPARFYPQGGEAVDVAMMHQLQDLDYAYGPDYQAVSLPYQGQALSMLILLPDSGAFKSFEASLTPEKVAEIVAQMSPTTVDLALPKFTLESNYNLATLLAEMGMPLAFKQEAADFSGIDGTHLLYIDDVIHKGFVAVDEKGTEAAGATAVVVACGTSAPPPKFTADRPFIILIRDDETGAILFMGRVASPS